MKRALPFALLLVLTPALVFAEAYPTKVVTIIVPFAQGGPTDTVARLIAQSMTGTLGKKVTVENIGGGGGTNGTTRAAKASADGYTLLLHHIGMATSATLYRKLGYDAINDFDPIGLVTDVPMTLVAKKALPAKDLRELIEYVKKNKSKVSYANAGIGAASHLCGMLFMRAIQTPLTTVPYKGTAPAMNALLAGKVDVMCDQTTNTTSQIKADKIKVYGVTTRKRVPSLPEVPTLAEAGLPDVEISIWHGLYAPKGTPAPVIDRLVGTLQTALTDPQVKARFAELGSEPVAADRARPDALRAHLKAEIDRWAPIIKAAGQYAD